ncbi:hypothetical protein GGI20_001288 [Coemansia sp. BCRC 34301]|nr:hypothetical protein GGI20_001288 [Coemansia sp. BCRC 34301]
MRVLVYVLATVLAAVGVASRAQSEAAQESDESQSTFSDLANPAVITIDSAISDASTLSSQASETPSTSSHSTLSTQPSETGGQFKCMSPDGVSDIYTEQVDGRLILFQCLRGTRCFQSSEVPSRIKCENPSSVAAVEGAQRLASRHWKGKGKGSLTALESGKHYFAEVAAEIDAGTEVIPMSTVNLDLPLANIPTSSEPKVISLNIVLPTIAVKITEDPDAPNIATVISIDPIAEPASLTSIFSSTLDSLAIKTLTRVVIGTPSPTTSLSPSASSSASAISMPSPNTSANPILSPSPRFLTVTATVTASAPPLLTPSASLSNTLTITASSDVSLFTQLLTSHLSSDDQPPIDKQRHAITVNGVDLSSVLRPLKPTTTTVFVPASPSTPPPSPASTLSAAAQPTQQRVSALPSSVLREFSAPPLPPLPMVTANPSTAPMVFQGSDFRDPPAASEVMGALTPATRPPRQSMQIVTPAPTALFAPTQVPFPQSAPSVWYPSLRMSAPASPLSAPQPLQPIAMPPSLPPPPPPITQTELPTAPLITVVMHPNYGFYSMPISSSPFGMYPQQFAQAPPFSTILPASNVLPSIEALPPNNSVSADAESSHTSLIIPFISNGQRQPTPTNTPEPLPKVKTSDINAHGIVSVLQEVFHIPPSAISIDGKPIAPAGDREGKGSANGSKNNHGDGDNDKDDDSDNDDDPQDNGNREQDLELDSRYNIGEIARSRRKLRTKIKAVGRMARTLSKQEGHNSGDGRSSGVGDDTNDDINGDSDPNDQTATALSTDSADKASIVSTSMNLASHGAALLSVALPSTTLSAAMKIEQFDDADNSTPATQTNDS